VRNVFWGRSFSGLEHRWSIETVRRVRAPSPPVVSFGVLSRSEYRSFYRSPDRRCSDVDVPGWVELVDTHLGGWWPQGVSVRIRAGHVF